MQSMSPTLWRTCRVIANNDRLNLLRILINHGEATVTLLGKQAMLLEPHASLHLRMLNSRGLITARFSGKWVYYRAVANHAVEHAPAILDALKTSFSLTENDNTHIVKAATAFTHRRRIVIVRHLQQAAWPINELSKRTKIPRSSLIRHLDKLLARRIIKSEHMFYSAGCPSQPLAKTLLSIASSQHARHQCCSPAIPDNTLRRRSSRAIMDGE